tara:strand:+ start:226 stop:387 length:162 start_codon:yes stop_codon:yes gene_type:complete
MGKLKNVDKYSGLEIPNIITSKYNGLWHGGNEYFLLDKENDTIASHGFNDWIQ